MSIEEDILKKLSIKELGQHLANYLDLYIKPLTVWKKVINNRTTSYDLVILHIVYYTLFIILVLKQSFSYSIFYVLLEMALTIIPFIIFFLPFKIFTSLLKKKIKWNRLFRLLVILKLQFLPIIILILLFAQWSKDESIYVILGNLTCLLLLLFILILPLLLSIKLWQKVLWILSNYICFLVFIISAIIISDKIDPQYSFLEKISKDNTPDAEYKFFELKRFHSENIIKDDYIISIMRKNDGEKSELIRIQFVTTQLLLSFKITDINQTRKTIKDNDSIRRISDTIKLGKTWIDSLTFYPKSEELTLEKLDSLQLEFDQMFTNDLSLAKTLKDSAKFQSNRNYFSAFYDYLNNYQKNFTDMKMLLKVVSNKKNKPDIIRLEKNYYIFLDKVDSTFYIDKKQKYFNLQAQIDKRTKKTNFIQSILLYPLYTILDIISYEE